MQRRRKAAVGDGQDARIVRVAFIRHHEAKRRCRHMSDLVENYQLEFEIALLGGKGRAACNDTSAAGAGQFIHRETGGEIDRNLGRRQ